MKQFPKLKQKSQKGFTLIEVLIVVIVLGLISAIAVPAFNNSIERAASVKLIESVTDNIADATRSLLVTTGTAPAVANSPIPDKDAGFNLLDVLVQGVSAVDDDYKLDYEDASITKLDRQITVVKAARAASVDGDTTTAAVPGEYKVNGYEVTYTGTGTRGEVIYASVPENIVARIEKSRDNGTLTNGSETGKVTFTEAPADSGLYNLTLLVDL